MDGTVEAPHFVRKLLVALACGLVTYVITTATDQPTVWELTITVFISGVALIVQNLMDVESRLVWVSEATRTRKQIEDAKLPTAVVMELISATTAIGPTEPDIIYAFAEAEVQRLTALLKDMRTDECSFPGEDNDWLVTLTHCAKRSIDATSTVVDVVFWDTDLGRRYLTAQHEASRRGVRVRRLFVVDSQADIDDVLRRRCEQHVRHGVQVRIAVFSELPEEAKTDKVRDCIVFDDEATYEVQPELVRERPVIDVTRMVWRDKQVEQRAQRFEDLWAVGVQP